MQKWPRLEIEAYVITANGHADVPEIGGDCVVNPNEDLEAKEELPKTSGHSFPAQIDAAAT